MRYEIPCLVTIQGLPKVFERVFRIMLLKNLKKCISFRLNFCLWYLQTDYGLQASNNQSINLRYVSHNAVQRPIAASPEEKKVAHMIKTQNVSLKKNQKEVNKLLDKIVAAIELSCGGK